MEYLLKIKLVKHKLRVVVLLISDYSTPNNTVDCYWLFYGY